MLQYYCSIIHRQYHVSIFNYSIFNYISKYDCHDLWNISVFKFIEKNNKLLNNYRT